MKRFPTKKLFVPALAAVSLALGGTLAAVDFNWTDATLDNNWLTPGNWSPAGPPAGGGGNFARFYTGAPGPANITSDIPAIQDILFANDGTAGTRTVNHSAGTAPLTAGWVRMGVDPDDGGALTGAGDAGTYNLSGTGVVNTGRLNIAEVNGSTATFTQAGTSVFNSLSELNVGQSGVGTFTQTGGNFNYATVGGSNPVGDADGLLRVSQNASSAGSTYTMSGGTLTQTAVTDLNNQGNWNSIGEGTGSNGTFNLSGGAEVKVSFDARTFVGRNGTGTVNQTGGVFEIRRSEVNLGDTGGTGTYNISNGTFQTLGGGPIVVGQWTNGTGNLNVSATGVVNASGDLIVANGSTVDNAHPTGTVTQNGGSVNVSGRLYIANSSLSRGTYRLQGGVLDLTNGNIDRGAGNATFEMTGGTLRGVNNMAGSTADNTFTQQGGAFEIGGTVGGGGVTTLNANYSLLSGGTISFDISNGVADRLNVNGTVTLAGNLDLVGSGPMPPMSVFTILANDGTDPVVGSFLGRFNGVPFVEDGNTYTVFYNSGDGNDVILVPEPGSLVFLLGGVGMFGLLARRRRTR